ncbi:cellulose biosynthesis cyclic di-GMP-binding regulatory protein BcsB [Paenibacillus sp. J22TS3]|uniref:cellulose biosynthesis cyclic di-GMP-binding regulatory protein BcsB n=1 Tax=Paenibacillus sp. J22TS3 TaxID=2807192 RepID=UPI001B02D4F1|nr:cellulose biosynthesis cyclic di-GMP-binding regulatory protein BcsB [Paenibacillus sp. J22TS3]GIP22632.1 glycosyl transferase [Paenibacillus sp. J22TS3]
MNTKSTVSGILCLILFFITSGQVFALPDSSGRLTYEAPLTTSNVSLSGVTASSSMYIRLEDYWNVNSLTLHLDYQATQLAAKEHSSVTLKMNGTGFYSFRPVVEKKQMNLTVPVPKELLVQGNNTLSINGYIVTDLPDGVCVPTEKRDSWLELYKTSYAEINYTKQAIGTSIHSFYQQFVGTDTLKDKMSALAVPNHSDSSELEAAVYALSGLAKGNRSEDATIPMLTLEDADLAQRSQLVIVSLFKNLPDKWKTALGQPDVHDKALIRMVNAGSQSALIVTSDDPLMLKKAGRFVGNVSLVSQVDGPEKWIDQNTNVETPAINVSRDVTLTETGDKLTGMMHQEKSYFVSLPANRSIAESSKISLDFRYSDNLDFDRSLVTILINDTPIGSKKLTKELSNQDELTLTIPKNLGSTGSITVTAAFDLELKSAGCIELQDQMPWAYITKDSLLQLNTKDRTDMLFNSYPNPFLRDASFNQIAVLVPDKMDPYDYLTVGSLFHLLGKYAEANTGQVTFYKNQELPADSKMQHYNLISVGSFKDNPWLQKHNNKLFFQYSQDGERFVSNEKMSIEENYGKRIGTLQLMESPYNQGYGWLAVTGPSSKTSFLVSNLLSSDSMKWKVYGDGVVTDVDGNTKAFRFKKEVQQEGSGLVEQITERGDVLAFIVALALTFILVVVSLIFLIRKYRKKAGEE